MLILKIFFASFSILFLPGRLVAKALGWDKDLDAIETVPLSFALSSLLILAVSLVVFAYHLNMGIARNTIYAAIAVLFAFNIYKYGLKNPGKRHYGLQYDRCEIFMMATAVILASGIFFVLFDIGSPVLGVGVHKENAFHAIIMKKIADAQALRLDEITYKKGLTQTYLIPQWHFMIALVGRAAFVDIAILYERIRGVLFLFMACLYYSFAKILVNRRFAVFFVLCLMVMLIAGDYSDYYYSTFNLFAVFTHPGQIGAAVCPMLLIILTMYALKDRKENMFWILPLIVFNMSMIQGRQGLQYIYHIGLLMLVYLSFALYSGKKLSSSLVFKLSYAMIGTILLGLAYKFVQTRLSPHVSEWEQMDYADTFLVLRDMVKSNWKYAIDYFGMRNPFSGAGSNQLWIDFYITITVMCLPFIVWLKRHLFALIAFSTLLFTIIVIKIPIMSLLITKMTYSEFLQAPIRYIFWIAILITILLFYSYLKAIDGLRSKFPEKAGRILIIQAVLLYFVLFPLAFILPRIERWQHIFFWILMAVSLVSYLLAIKYWKHFAPKAYRLQLFITRPIQNQRYFNVALSVALAVYLVQSQNFPFSTYHWNTRFSTSDRLHAEKLLSGRIGQGLTSQEREAKIAEIMVKHKKALWDIYAESQESGRINIKTIEGLYAFAERDMGGLPPYELIAFLNKLDSHKIIAYPLEKWEEYQPIFLLPLFTDNFIYSSGKTFAGEFDFKGSYETMIPLYPSEPEQSSVMADPSGVKKIIATEGIDLIVVTPRYYQFYKKFLGEAVLPGISLNVIWDKDSYMVVEAGKI